MLKLFSALYIAHAAFWCC